jgi:hypothetical protein
MFRILKPKILMLSETYGRNCVFLESKIKIIVTIRLIKCSLRWIYQHFKDQQCLFQLLFSKKAAETSLLILPTFYYFTIFYIILLVLHKNKFIN